LVQLRLGKFLGLLNLEIVGEGADEGSEECAVDERLRLSGNELEEREGVVAGQVELRTVLLERTLRTRQETQVVLQHLQIHQ
jgi:hypothetical protein